MPAKWGFTKVPRRESDVAPHHLLRIHLLTVVILVPSPPSSASIKAASSSNCIQLGSGWSGSISTFSWWLCTVAPEGASDGYQSVPTQWGINTERKQAFFEKVREIVGG